MGTRNLTIVVKNKEYVVAQYGQWDGYPDGQGATVLNFLRDEFSRREFNNGLENFKFADQDQIDKLLLNMDIDPEKNSFDEGERFIKRHPGLTRNTAAKILSVIQNSEEAVYARNEIDFISDGLMCEWAYVIDMDTENFEVYKGFNTTGLDEGERFKGFAPYTSYSGTVYYPPCLVAKYSLHTLPTVEDMISDTNEEEEE